MDALARARQDVRSNVRAWLPEDLDDLAALGGEGPADAARHAVVRPQPLVVAVDPIAAGAARALARAVRAVDGRLEPDPPVARCGLCFTVALDRLGHLVHALESAGGTEEALGQSLWRATLGAAKEFWLDALGPGRPLDRRRPLVMGIVNVTPDSFSDGGRYAAPADAVAHGRALAAAGADLLDVGGESTRPGAAPVDAAEERRRVVGVIAALRREFPALPLSIDTRKAAVAEAAFDAGADLLNDVSALAFDPDLAPLAAARGVPVILMHARGVPATMQRHTRYRHLLADCGRELRGRVEAALTAGIHPDRLIADPGIGFGKTAEQNWTLLRRLRELRSLGLPLAVGASRKSFLGWAAGAPVGERGHATVAAETLALLSGAALLRTHDVAAARAAVAVVRAWRGGGAPAG